MIGRVKVKVIVIVRWGDKVRVGIWCSSWCGNGEGDRESESQTYVYRYIYLFPYEGSTGRVKEK